MKILNKRGEFAMSIWWFFIIVIVGVVFAAGVAMFSSGEVDINKIEADTLSSRILACLNYDSENGINVLKGDYNMLNSCGLNEKLFYANGQLTVSVQILEKDKILKEFNSGNPSYIADCDLVLGGKFTFERNSYPGCKILNSKLKLGDGRIADVKIVSAVNGVGGWIDVK